MLIWQDGPPKQTGLVVVEWMNGGGLQVFDIQECDGILFAFSVKMWDDRGCTRLDKWAIKRHVLLPHPHMELLHSLFSRSGEAVIEARRQEL